MAKKVIVFSLGGSLIVPSHVDLTYVTRFCSFITHLSRQYKIVVVCGGGSLARQYIDALSHEIHKTKVLSYLGIGATKLNARFISGFFSLPIAETMGDLKKQLRKQDIVVCGALAFKPSMTSDGTAAEVAVAYHSLFINLTNVDGLYDSDPHINSRAQLIRSISFVDFLRIVRNIKYKAGQHFVLDQTAAGLIARHHVSTAIIHGHHLSEVLKFLKGKSFYGTLIR